MTPKIDYRIKLLSGNNVVLVEANGYDSEIFMPHTVNGRITFLNVIPNRRCCQLKVNSKVGGNNLRTNIKCEQTTPAQVEMPKMGRFSVCSDKENDSRSLGLLAMSTPACAGKTSMGAVRIKAGQSSLMTPNQGGDSTLPTPEPIRRAAPPRKDLVVDNTMYHLPRGVKVMRLYHNSTDDTPRKVGRLVSTTNGGSITQGELLNLSRMTDLSNSFRTDASPQMNNSKIRGIVSSTPINKKLANVVDPASVGKWRKCITPKITYSRRGNHEVRKHDKSLTSLNNCKKPSYLVNPTMAPKTTHVIEVKKRRLRVDEQVRIPSKVLKKRQIKNNKFASSTSKSEYLQKSRKHLGKSPMSAFDLLTNSNRTRCISNKLNQQFRKGCTNKASSTYTKYRVLSSVPPLQEDEQILELTRSQSVDQSVEQIDRVKANEDYIVTQMVSRATSTMLPVTHNNNAVASKSVHTFAKPRIPPQKFADTRRLGKTEKPSTHYVLKF